MSFDFITIDFETANSNNSSACSVGIVGVKNNNISETYYSLIKPYGLHFDQANVEIHGITADDVKDAPSFPEVWEQIKHYFNNNMIIAHNAAFDMSVLKTALMSNNIALPSFNYLCSIPISTRACESTGIGRSLKERAEHFNLKLDNHHNALDDALTCANLVIKCIEVKKRRSFESYCRTFSSLPVKSFEDLKPQIRFGKNSRFEHVKISELEPTISDIDETHILYNKNIVFTGELLKLTRKTAMQLATDCGAKVRSGVNKKTNYLIVGAQDKRIVGEDGLSNKEELAYDLIKEGNGIQIISEQEFINLSGGLPSASTT